MRSAVLAVVLASCGGNTPPHAPQTFQVEIRGMQFVPASLHVHPGDVVTWTNRDIVPHTATSSSGWFDSKVIAPGDHWTYVIEQPVEMDYGCTMHPIMKGKLLPP
jgi:plastocyanin